MDDKELISPTLTTPNPWSKTLIEALLPFTTVNSYRRGVRLGLEEDGLPVCRLIVTGSAKVYRAADQLLIATAGSFNILGYGGQNATYILTVEPCRIATLSLDEFHKRVEELGLWEILAKHMITVNNKLFYYSKLLSTPTAYEAICNQLMELILEPAQLRETVSVERYIRERTHLSRSSIMKILADLKKGGYITIEEGRLLKIHHLPSKY